MNNAGSFVAYVEMQSVRHFLLIIAHHLHMENFHNEQTIRTGQLPPNLL